MSEVSGTSCTSLHESGRREVFCFLLTVKEKKQKVKLNARVYTDERMQVIPDKKRQIEVEMKLRGKKSNSQEYERRGEERREECDPVTFNFCSVMVACTVKKRRAVNGCYDASGHHLFHRIWIFFTSFSFALLLEMTLHSTHINQSIVRLFQVQNSPKSIDT